MTALAELPPILSQTLSQVIDVFDRELASDLPFVNRLTEQVRAYRGKLLRPRLLLLSAQAVGDIRPEHVTLAAVVEMVHMATLVHDDVLDDADIRRHSQTVNRLIGNEGAVLLGDYLISHAYHLCSSLGSTWAARRVAAVTNTVCEGELLQVQNRDNYDMPEPVYFEIIRRKTAALTSLCCELGAEAGHASASLVEQLAAYGRDLGIAFQIVDDLLDLAGAEIETGKTLGRDADLGKMTLPVIRCLASSSRERRSRLVELLRCDSSRDGRARLLAESGAIDEARGVAQDYVQSAIARLSALPESDAKDALVAAAEFVTVRRQ